MIMVILSFSIRTCHGTFFFGEDCHSTLYVTCYRFFFFIVHYMSLSIDFFMVNVVD